MKKTRLILTAAALCGSFSSAAFASPTVISSSTTIGGGTFAPSTKVGLSAYSASTSYTVTSAHLSGTFQYGSGGGSAYTGDPTKIMYATIPSQATNATVGAPIPTTSATALPSPASGSWTAQ